MKKKIFAAIAVALFIGVAGCSGSAPLDADVTDAIDTDGDVTDIATIWDQDEGGNVENEGGNVENEGGNVENEGGSGKGADGGEDECDFDAPTLSIVGNTTVEVGEDVDIALTVKGGSGNFRWNVLGNIPLGPVFKDDEDKGSIEGIADQAGEFPLKINVRDLECSETSNDVSFLLTVKELEIEMPTVELEEVGKFDPEDIETIQAHRFGLVKEVRVHTTTGSLKRAGTDADISIKFCEHKDFANCGTEFYALVEKSADEDRGKGDTNTYKIKGEWTKDELKYFVISTSHNRGGAGWMLEGIKVEYVMEGGSKQLAYWNPCVHKVLNGLFDHLFFGPEDVSICSVVDTSNIKDAGTNDKVYLIFPDYEYNDMALNGDYDYKEGPYFTDKFDFLAIKLGWDLDDYDDFEKGDEGHYGDYSFDRDPFRSTEGVPTGVNVQKARDSKKGGWYLRNIFVIVFKPAQNFVYAKGCTKDNACDAQIKEHTLMYYAMRKNLSEAEGWIQSSSSKGKREGLNLGAGPSEGMLEFKPRAEWVDSFTLEDFSEIGRHKP